MTQPAIDVAAWVAPVDIGPQPPPLLSMAVVAPSDLPNAAKLVLGINAEHPDGQLGGGWHWVAFRSLGYARKPKRLDDPERWVSVEVYSLRLAGGWSTLADPERLRVVVTWERDVVVLSKAARSKRTGRRPVKAGAWRTECWTWVSGRDGSIPLVVLTDTVKTMIREDSRMATRTRKTPDAAAIDTAADERFAPDPTTEDGRRQITSVLDALDRTPELVGMLREGFEALHQAMLDAESKAAGGLGAVINAPSPDLAAARLELDGIVAQTGHPALRVVLAHLDDVTTAELDPAGADQASDARVDAAAANLLAEQREQVATLTEQLAALELERVRQNKGGRPGALDDEALRDALVTAGAYLPVPKRWADIGAADIFVGRAGDLWVVKTPMGARDEFTKGKGTVQVAQGGKVYARDFDPDETANVLVPVAVEAAHQVLVDLLGASTLLGASVPA